MLHKLFSAWQNNHHNAKLHWQFFLPIKAHNGNYFRHLCNDIGILLSVDQFIFLLAVVVLFIEKF